MSERSRSRMIQALWVGLILLVLGIVGYMVEDARATEHPHVVGDDMPWSHTLHARHPDHTCQSCHHKSRPGQSDMPPCGACHPTSPGLGQEQPEPSEASVRRQALHNSCVGCHKAIEDGPTECADCHQQGPTSADCARCHEPTATQLAGGGHALVSCAACHTNLEDNLVNDQHPRPVPRAATQEQCLACHGDLEPDAAGFPRKRFADCPVHGELERAGPRACLDCHQPHDPAAQSPAGRRRPLRRIAPHR